MKKLSEIDLMCPVLCRYENTSWSSTMEIMKLNYSKDKRLVYVRLLVLGTGQSVINHFWCDVEDLDKKYSVVDVI